MIKLSVLLIYFVRFLFKIKVPHPSYPSTRISVQVPNLGVHFSPSRYRRIMELLNIFYGTMETRNLPASDNFQDELTPWSSVDLASDTKILVWRVCPQLLLVFEKKWLAFVMHLIGSPLPVFWTQGIGNSVATWQPCFLVLSGLYLYLLESEKSPTYQRYSRFASIYSLIFHPSCILLVLFGFSLWIKIHFLNAKSCNRGIFTFFTEKFHSWDAAAWLVNKYLMFLQQTLVACRSVLQLVIGGWRFKRQVK